jgi:hypothetical protein
MSVAEFKTFIVSTLEDVMKKVLLSSLFLLASTLASAGPVPNGTYSGWWCGYDVTYRVTFQDGSISRGVMYIADLEDQISIQSNVNGGLNVTRYLSGAYTGQTQWLSTNAPQVRFRNGGRFQQYQGPTGGPFCQNVGDIWIPAN